MPSTYTTNLRLTKQGNGENANTWGDIQNVQHDLIDEAISGVHTVNCTTGTDAILATSNGATDQARKAVLVLSGTPINNINVIIPAVTKTYDIDASGLLGAFTVTIKTSGGSGVAIAAGEVSRVYCDGTNTKQLSLPNNSVTNAKLRQGVANSVIGRSANSTGDVADIQASSNNTVLSRVADTTGFNTVQETLGTQTANTLLAGPTSGSEANPSFRALNANDLPNKTQEVLTSGTSWTVPSNVTRVYAQVIGGGGGGGCHSANGAYASQGGGGGYSAGWLTVTPGGTVSIGVGAGGNGSASTGASGSTGGTTTFGTISATGGGGGQSADVYSTSLSGGAGGTGSGGTLNLTGQTGGSAFTNSGSTSTLSQGGDSPLGYGKGGQVVFFAQTFGVVGAAGTGYGGGGVGGLGNGSAIAGGNGAPGVIILEY
jgi:hypothetical protein